MNDEELAALAEKLLAQGLSDDEVVEHLTRAKHGGSPKTEDEGATTALEAGAMQATDAVSMGLMDRPESGPTRAFKDGSRPASARERAAEPSQQESADERELALAIAEQEHPTASKVGRYGTLALPIVGMGPKGVMAAGKGLAKGGGRLLDVAKALMSEAPIVGRRGMVGRPIRAAAKAWHKGGVVPDVPSVLPKSGAFETPPQGSFPAIEGTGGGQSTFGMSAGEARAANAPGAYAREHAARTPLAEAKKIVKGDPRPGYTDAGNKQRSAPKARMDKGLRDMTARYAGYSDEALQDVIAKSQFGAAKDAARAELAKRAGVK